MVAQNLWSRRGDDDDVYTMWFGWRAVLDSRWKINIYQTYYDLGNIFGLPYKLWNRLVAGKEMFLVLLYV